MISQFHFKAQGWPLSALNRGLIKLLLMMLVISSLFASSCSAQEQPQIPPYEIAQKKGSLKDYSEKFKIPVEKLRSINPGIRKDRVNKNDTVYLLVTAAKPVEGESETVLGKSKLFKEVRFEGKRYFVFEVDPHKYKIELFNHSEKRNTIYDFELLAKEKKNELIFAMNAGMFEKDLSPVGLFISGSKTYRKVNLRKSGSGNFYDLSPNGIFLLDSNENASVIPSDMYNEDRHKVRLATQSGPMLVINGLFNKKFIKGSSNRYIRNGVGINKNQKVVFVVSLDMVNFYELADFFKTKLGCLNALYLDGAISQYYAPDLHPAPKQQSQLGTFLTVSHKTPMATLKPVVPAKADSGKGNTKKNK